MIERIDMPNSQFRNLVFEGGGVKGIAYAGALSVLESKGILGDITRVAGTSAGAITATLVAIGCSAKDVEQVVGGTSFRSFMDANFGLVRNTERLLHDYGWYKGDTFSEWIQKILDAHGWKSDLTFGELRKLVRNNPGSPRKELTIVGSNISAEIPQVFSADTTPDTPIWRAVRISMSIPLFFAAVKDEASHSTYVDGGVTWNYPLDIFDERQYVEDPKAAQPVNYPTTWGPEHVYNKETLGLRLGTRDEILVEKGLATRPPREIHDFIGYLKGVVDFMLEVLNRSHLHDNDWHRTVFLDTLGVRSTQFDLSEDTVTKLVESGREGANAYFKWFEDAAARPAPKNRM
jgi:NTE family protein